MPGLQSKAAVIYVLECPSFSHSSRLFWSSLSSVMTKILSAVSPQVAVWCGLTGLTSSGLILGPLSVPSP